MTVIVQSGYRTALHYGRRERVRPPVSKGGGRLEANRRTDNVRTSTRSIDTSALASTSDVVYFPLASRAREPIAARSNRDKCVSSIMQGIKLQRAINDSRDAERRA